MNELSNDSLNEHNIIETLNLDGKKYYIANISGYIIFQDDAAKQGILASGGELSREKKLDIFNKKVPDFQAFKSYVVDQDGYWDIKINGEDVVDGSISIFEECLIIVDLSIHPRFRNAGIGEKTVKYIEQFVKESGYRCIALTVHANIRPLRFWRKVGFIPINKVDKEHIVPLLEKLNNVNILIVDDDGHDHMIEMKLIL